MTSSVSEDLEENSCLRQRFCKKLLFFILQNKKEARDFSLDPTNHRSGFIKQKKRGKNPLCRIYKNQRSQRTQRKSRDRPPPPLRVSVSGQTSDLELLLGVGDLHGAGCRDPEALQRVFGHARLGVALKLHEGDVVFPRDQTHLFETWKPAEDEERHTAQSHSSSRRTDSEGSTVSEGSTHWLNSMDSIISLVSSGRLLRNRM